jgi:hypothetical protein
MTTGLSSDHSTLMTTSHKSATGGPVRQLMLSSTLIVGTNQHSAGGIMQGRWRYQQIVSAAQGLLQFDRGERLRILGNMRRRMLAAEARRPESDHGHRD